MLFGGKKLPEMMHGLGQGVREFKNEKKYSVQVVVIVYVLFISKYRKHSFLIIMLVAAIITPPDLMTLTLVTIPLYLLYEISIRVMRWVER